MEADELTWRVSAEIRASLEEEASRAGVSVDALLDRITQTWLDQQRRAGTLGEADQARIRTRVLQFVGSIAGGDPTRAGRAGELVREKLRERRG